MHDPMWNEVAIWAWGRLAGLALSPNPELADRFGFFCRARNERHPFRLERGFEGPRRSRDWAGCSHPSGDLSRDGGWRFEADGSPGGVSWTTEIPHSPLYQHFYIGHHVNCGDGAQAPRE